jgi:hypothetical protein
MQQLDLFLGYKHKKTNLPEHNDLKRDKEIHSEVANTLKKKLMISRLWNSTLRKLIASMKK